MKNAKTIKEVANYIIEGHTILEASSHFSLSERTIQNYIKELSLVESPFYNKNLYDRVRLAQDKMRIMKAKEGGKIGKRSPSVGEFDLEEIALVMIENRLSLSMASKYFSIPVSTLYDGLKRLDETFQKELTQLYEDNKTRNLFDGVSHTR